MADITKTLKPTRVVKGNTFKITIPMQQITGYDSANNPILTDVDLTGCEADTSVTLYSMYGKTVKDFTISGINISFTVDGDLNNGQYDIEVKTVKNGQKLRMDLKNALRIVNYNEDADLPSGTEFGSGHVHLAAADCVCGRERRRKRISDCSRKRLCGK
jgi:hypothetical protein